MFVQVSSVEEFDNLIKTGVCILDFNAQWCGPCKVLSKNLPELISKDESISSYKNLKILSIDVDNFSDLAETYKVSCLPYIIFYSDGKLSDYFVKGNDPNKIIQIIKLLINKN